MGYAIAVILLIAYIQRSGDLQSNKDKADRYAKYILRLFLDKDFQGDQAKRLRVGMQEGKKPLELVEKLVKAALKEGADADREKLKPEIEKLDKKCA